VDAVDVHAVHESNH